MYLFACVCVCVCSSNYNINTIREITLFLFVLISLVPKQWLDHQYLWNKGVNWMRSENMRTLSSSCWHLLEAVVSARLWWPKGASGMNQAVRTTLSKTSHNHSFLQNLWWFPIYQELANYAPWTISILIPVFSFFNCSIIALQYCVVFCHTTMWVDTWMDKKLWYKYMMEYYSTLKRNKSDLVELRWLNLEPVIQSEVGQKENNKYHIVVLYMKSRKMVLMNIFAG